MSFVHLHVHTQYSIADALTRTADMAKFAAKHGMPAIALTDHDNLHGAIQFTQACKAPRAEWLEKNKALPEPRPESEAPAEVKPIYGCCLAIAKAPMGEHVKRVHHLTLLAENLTGWQNLMFLVSQAHHQAPSGAAPRVSWELLAAHAEGLIGLSGDLSGEIANALLRGDEDDARRHAERYKALFAPGSFYIEVQSSGLLEHDRLMPKLLALAASVGLPCVATNDTHYLAPGNARAHEVLLCIGLGLQSRPEDEALPTEQLDLASPEEMRRRFAGYEHLCDETLRIAERCNVKLHLGDPMLPAFPTGEGESEVELFTRLAREGLERRFGELRERGEVFEPQVYLDRLEREIGVICHMKFPGYFLIVQDFINWAKTQGIPVGPGRGSGAGSLVAWSLRITDLDPIPYNLLFERFLNPERVSMPDFDIDFCVERRGEVIRYVAQKYGEDRVGQIATFGTLKAKGAVRDVGRVLGVPLPDVDRVARLVDRAVEPFDDKHKSIKYAIAGIDDAIEAVRAKADKDGTLDDPEVKEKLDELRKAQLQAGPICQEIRSEMAQLPEIAKLLETAQLLEGAVRNVGMHAAGVVIGRGPLWEHVPVGRGQNGENVTQFDKDDVEKAGLVKFDFLGLKNLTMIQHCVALVRDRPDAADFDLAKVPLDDPRPFELISRGDTAGIFQMESSGFTEMVRKMKPSVFPDIIAAGALYRPGPLDQKGEDGRTMVDTFIDRKHGRDTVTYPHPSLETILQETYGVIVYQEQVMQISQVLAGYSLGRADLLRRAMGKKKPEVMAKERAGFVEGALGNDVAQATAESIFNLMEKFAAYGFNKSHSAAYGLITYHTAYLKSVYPVQFYAALLSADQSDTDKVVQYIQQARTSPLQAGGIQVLPPDINESSLGFSVIEDRIRFGLGAIRGLGELAIEQLVAARQADGPFQSLFDLCQRVDTQKVNKKALEVLIKAGACDGFGQKRDVLIATVDRAVLRARDKLEQQTDSQLALFAVEPEAYVQPQAWSSDVGKAPAAVDGEAALADDAKGQLGLFGDAPTAPAGPTEVKSARSEETGPKFVPWTQRELLAYEKEVLGFYVSGHPLERYRPDDLSRLGVRALAKLKETELPTGEVKFRDRVKAQAAVLVVSHRELVTKKGTRMGISVIEDRSGQAEVLTFQKALETASPLLSSEKPLLLTLSLSPDREDPKQVRFAVEAAEDLEAAILGQSRALRLQLTPRQCEADELRRLRQVLVCFPGTTRTVVQVKLPNAGDVVVAAGDKWRVEVCDGLLERLERLLGRGCVRAS